MSHTEEPFYCTNFRAPLIFRETIYSKVSAISEIIIIIIIIIIMIIVIIVIWRQVVRTRSGRLARIVIREES